MDLRLLTAVALLASAAVAMALGGNPNVRFSSSSGAFPLIRAGVPASVWVDVKDWPGVARAAGDLYTDLSRVAGYQGEMPKTGPQILAGTIGHSPLIDGLIQSGKLDVSAVQGRWEAAVTQVVDMPGHGPTLVIAGADKRGTIYALYDISESAGVSPWYWWADVPVKNHRNVYITGRYVAKSPVVKYRGIFLNDEAPSLTNWVKQFFGDYKHEFYQHIFELLLRLRANYLWPAMWNNCFSEDDPLNPKLADEYGIVMGTSHVEPMMRADKEWNRLGFTERQWNYDTNPEQLEKFWRDGVVRNKPYENIVTVAMRGKIDTPMSESANIALLEKIVAAQRRILAEAVNPNVAEIPQLWCLYKEVQEYYEKGMRVPDDVTLLWADDNWGDIRRLPTPDERKRTGGAGVYYHYDYVGGPRNYKWIDTNPIPKVWEQMTLAHHYGADRIWIVNVGDLQPKAFSTEFFLTLAQDPDAIKKEDLAGYTKRWAEREFGPKYAAQIAELISATARLNGRRKPELLDPSTYSLLNYREADRIHLEWLTLLGEAREVGSRLPDEYRPAFYELVLHPISAPANLQDLYTAAAQNALLAREGDPEANAYADEVRSLFGVDAAITDEYHKFNGGKWNHMMDQTHIGYTSWQQPDRNIMPRVATVDVPATGARKLVIEGSADVWPAASAPPELHFTRFGQADRWVHSFATGQVLDAQISSQTPWIVVVPPASSKSQPDSGTRFIRIDWAKAVPGQNVGSIHVTGPSLDEQIRVVADNDVIPRGTPSGSFIEGDAVVAIEAEHTAQRVAAGGAAWETIPSYGRTLSAVKAFPLEFQPFEPGQGPSLEYRMLTFTGGTAKLDLIVSPSLAFQPGHGLRVAVAFDDQAPQVVDVAPQYLSREWERAVSDSVRHVVTKHDLPAGKHTLKIWAIDPGVVIERLVLDLGGLKPSYLGPPESVRSGR